MAKEGWLLSPCSVHSSLLAPLGLLLSGNLAEQPAETAFAAFASQPWGKYVPREASLGGCDPEGRLC